MIIVAGWNGGGEEPMWFDSVEEVQKVFCYVFEEGMTVEEMKKKVEEVNEEGNYNEFVFYVREEKQ